MVGREIVSYVISRGTYFLFEFSKLHAIFKNCLVTLKKKKIVITLN